MAPLDPSRLKRIQRASRSLRGLFIFLSVLLVLGTFNSFVHPHQENARAIAGVVFADAGLTPKIQILWFVQTLLAAALHLKALYHLIRLTGLYSQGKLFTEHNVAQIRQLGLTFLCVPLVWLAGLLAAAPEIMAAQDQWVQIMPTFPGGALVNGGIILFAGWIMNEGRELRDEQDLVI